MTVESFAERLSRQGVACGFKSCVGDAKPSARNEAYERMLKSDLKYRFVIDMAR